MNLKHIIEEGEKEFDEKFANGGNYLCLANETQMTSCSEDVKSFNHQFALKLIEAVKEMVEGRKKYHKEFECNGAHNGKGCYETFCEDQNCRNAPKEYNQALTDLLSELTIGEDEK